MPTSNTEPSPLSSAELVAAVVALPVAGLSSLPLVVLLASPPPVSALPVSEADAVVIRLPDAEPLAPGRLSADCVPHDTSSGRAPKHPTIVFIIPLPVDILALQSIHVCSA